MAANAATTTDILIELSTEEIIRLSQYYSQHQDVAPHIYSHLETVLSWQEKTPANEKKLIQIFAPVGGPAITSGTFVSLGHFPTKMIIVFTMEEKCELLSEIFATTKRFDYANETYLFFAVHEKHIPVLNKVMAELGLAKLVDDKTELWLINQEDASLKFPSYPPEYYLDQLTPPDSQKINDIWPHKTDNSEIYVRTLIEYNDGLGIYTKEDNSLVAWVLKSQIGQMALLQVVDGHKKKGLGQALIYAMSREIALDGFPALGTIVQTNEASKNLFAKCGFKYQFVTGYLIYK